MNSLRASLRAQTVVLFLLIVAFAASAEVIVSGELQASNAAQIEQVDLITWRYDTVRASLYAEELRTNLSQITNSQLSDDSAGAESYQELAQSDNTSIEAERSQISALKLHTDDNATIAKDAQT